MLTLFTGLKYLEYISSIRRMHNNDSNWTESITRQLMVNNRNGIQFIEQATKVHVQPVELSL
jgi:hypothetical protein